MHPHCSLFGYYFIPFSSIFFPDPWESCGSKALSGRTFLQLLMLTSSCLTHSHNILRVRIDPCKNLGQGFALQLVCNFSGSSYRRQTIAKSWWCNPRHICVSMHIFPFLFPYPWIKWKMNSCPCFSYASRDFLDSGYLSHHTLPLHSTFPPWIYVEMWRLPLRKSGHADMKEADILVFSRPFHATFRLFPLILPTESLGTRAYDVIGISVKIALREKLLWKRGSQSCGNYRLVGFIQEIPLLSDTCHHRFSRLIDPECRKR